MDNKWVTSACQKLDETGCAVFEKIAEKVEELGGTLVEGDYSYIHRKDGSKMKLGRFLHNIDEKLAKDYANYKQRIEYRKGGAVINISQEPEDILAKSTGQRWASCETVGGSHSAGIWDDIEANNAIAYLSMEDSPHKWIGRRMLRWCIREDDMMPDVVIERYYGDQNYSDITYKKLQEILRQKGFSGMHGDTNCITPYSYGGYVDSGRKNFISRDLFKEDFAEVLFEHRTEKITPYNAITYKVGKKEEK